MQPEKTSNGNGGGATLVSAGTTLKGDISSNSDLRIDGTIIGNVNSGAKIVIGANGSVEGNITGNQADVVGESPALGEIEGVEGAVDDVGVQVTVGEISAEGVVV